MKKQWLLGLVLCFAGQSAFAAQYAGFVSILEIWKNGNVAFSLNPAIPGCNSQVILNASAPGTKNQYAALLAAKNTGVQVSVYVSGTCIAAEGYGGGYHDPLYLYALDP